MPITHKEIKTLFDKDYTYSQTTREEAADDLVFSRLDQWADGGLENSPLAYKGQFNIVRKAERGILADLAGNPVQVDFEAVDENKGEAGETLDGMYRSDDQNNDTIEAYSNAEQEMVICGFGAWEIYTEYESLRSGDNNNQVIKRRPLPEANNTVYFGSNAKLLDKSDSTRCTILTSYTEDGYKDLVEDLTGERPENIEGSFGTPERSYGFNWYTKGSNAVVYVGTFYHREIIKSKVVTFSNPMGQEVTIPEADIENVMVEMIDQGYEIISNKEIDRWQVTKYIVSGKEILSGEMGDEERKGEIIAGEYIPVIPEYGERIIIGGEEHWEGVERLAKDPQRLINFQLSYLADIVSQSPRPKPIFNPEQIAGFEDMYAENGADNNYPYYLQNRKSENGEVLPVGPVALMPEQLMPTSLVASIQLSKEAIADVAGTGVPQNIADPALSGKAVLALQNKIEQQSMVYQEHRKHAKRHDGVVYASIASEIIDVPRTVQVVAPDGSRKKIKIMEQIYDEESGETVTINDINNVEFKVYSKIGPSYGSQKEQTLERIESLLKGINPADPKYDMMLMQYMALMDGSDFDDTRDYVKQEQLKKGFRKPETPEEEQMVAAIQSQPQQPSAEMVLAMAEDKKGQAALMQQKLAEIKMQLEFQNNSTKNEINAFGAQTDRMDTQIDAQEAGAKIDNTRSDTFGKQIQNSKDIRELIQPINMSDDALMAELSA